MPIYVGGDSVDVWAQRGEFDLDADGGAPPDYFNWLGQNWAAPLYNWSKMKADGFRWWRSRAAYNARLFDLLRFDHFRGVSEYWRIPRRPAILDEIAHETDKPRIQKEYEKVAWFWPIKFLFQFREKMSEGDWQALPEGARLEVLKHVNAAWMPGPGEPFLHALLESTTSTRGTGWVVEDLGADMDAVFALRDQMNLAGMRVAQFFGYDEKGRANPHVNPDQWPERSLAMTDTHDLPPLREWVDTLSAEERGRIAAVYRMDPPDGRISAEAFEKSIRHKLFFSPSRLVMGSLPTLLGLGAGHRINVPGTVGTHNWTWRMPMTIDQLPKLPELQRLIQDSHRRPN
jgi:4-alpha-glucanotransferase